MALEFYTPDGRRVLYLHIPKTGGTWVERILPRAGLDRCREPERMPGSSYLHNVLSQFPASYDVVFAAVRHPLAWYVSWFRYCLQEKPPFRFISPRRWHPMRALMDCKPRGGGFDNYIEECLEKQPAFVTRLYEWYLGPPEWNLVDFVCHTETLNRDVVNVLKELGCEARWDYILRAPPKRVSVTPVPEWNVELRGRVLASERVAVERFYSKTTMIVVKGFDPR